MFTAIQVGKAMRDAKRDIMDKGLSKTLATLVLAGDDGDVKLAAVMKNADAPFGFKVIKGRLDHFEIPAETRTMLFATALCDRPGFCVMYCAAIKTIFDAKTSKVTLSDFCEFFPFGFPIESEMKRIWDLQKNHTGQGSDNWLDHDEAWLT